MKTASSKSFKGMGVSMYWFLLVIAGLFEVGFTTCLGKAQGALGVWAASWYAGFILCLTISMALLVVVTKHLPIGTVYAVWTGIGAVGTVIVGIFVFKEPVTIWRLFFITTLIASIAGLKIVSN